MEQNTLGNLHVHTYQTAGQAAEALVHDLAQALALLREKKTPTLVLVSGGSALAVLDRIPAGVLGAHITIAMLDERYDPTNDASNFAALKKTQFFTHATNAGAQFISTLTDTERNHEQLASSFEEALRAWRNKHPNGTIIATAGIGADGHTAGIMPFPEDPETFARLFASDQWISAYDAGDKNPYPLRVSATLTFMRMINRVFVYLAGAEKAAAYARMHENTDVAHTPALILTELAGDLYRDTLI